MMNEEAKASAKLILPRPMFFRCVGIPDVLELQFPEFFYMNNGKSWEILISQDRLL